MSLLGKIEFAELTDTGRVREHNEDAIGSNPDIGLMVLADGMGGHAAGEVASGLAVEKFSAAYINNHDNVIDALRNSLDIANEQLAEAVLASPEYKGMGTTLTGTVIRNNHMYWVSVGDSPLWIFTNGYLRRVNADHSMVPLLDEMVTHGAMRREEALTDFRRNLLRSAVTGKEIKLVDLCQEPVQLIAGDMVMLASDGIETLSEHELAIIQMHPYTAYEILKDIQFPWPIAETIYQHHERLNGSGYPVGLCGDEVHRWARICAP